MTDAQTISVYDDKIETYRSLFTAPPNKSLLKFIDAIPKGGTVLDLGCGPGFAAAQMAKAGLKAHAMDASPEMVKAANKLGGVSAVQASFDDLPKQATYHGIYANFSLLHAPRADFPRHIRACYAALHDGGIFHLGLKLGVGEKRDALGRFYSFHTRQELMDILQGAGFEVLHDHEGAEVGMAGTNDPFIIILARHA